MTRLRTMLPVVLVATATLLAACGGDDDAAPDPPAVSVTIDPGITSGPAPEATVPDIVPENYATWIGPIDVIGEPLPPLEADIEADSARGLTAPTLVGLGFDGKPVRVDAAANGPTMVVFLAHWCPHCNAEVPRLIELRDTGRFPEELDIIAVATASDPQRPNFPPGEWLADEDWTWPAMMDGVDGNGAWTAAGAYGVSSFPFVVLLDAEGKVAARWSGESQPDEIVARIDEYLG